MEYNCLCESAFCTYVPKSGGTALYVDESFDVEAQMEGQSDNRFVDFKTSIFPTIAKSCWSNLCAWTAYERQGDGNCREGDCWHSRNRQESRPKQIGFNSSIECDRWTVQPCLDADQEVQVSTKNGSYSIVSLSFPTGSIATWRHLPVQVDFVQCPELDSFVREVVGCLRWSWFFRYHTNPEEKEEWQRGGNHYWTKDKKVSCCRCMLIV